MTPPFRQSGRYGSTVALTATRRSLVDVLLQVREQRQHLVVRPAVRNGRHLVPALADQLFEALSLREQSVVRDPRPEATLALESVALRARALPLAPSKIAGRGTEPRGVVGLRLHLDDRLHRRVEDAAELSASTPIRSDAIGLEPRVRHVARDGVELAAEFRDPPAVVDVLRGDVDAHGSIHGCVQPVDRDLPVGIRELPVELMRIHLDDEWTALGLRARHVLDPRQLVEDERGDRGQDQNGNRGPDQLEPGGAVDLRSFHRAWPATPAVLDDEQDQGALDEHEDRAGEDRDPDVRVVDAPRVGRVRRGRRKTSVACVGDRSEHQHGAQSNNEDEDLAPHRHATRPSYAEGPEPRSNALPRGSCKLLAPTWSILRDDWEMSPSESVGDFRRARDPSPRALEAAPPAVP